MQLKVWNTLTKRLDMVQSSSPDGILRIYHCGPTVYDSPHIGNLRRFLTADLLMRSLKLFHYRTKSVMNITDVGHILDEGHEAAGEDRMVVAARRNHHSPEHIAATYTKEFHETLQLLHANPADLYPKATDYIHSMIDLITILLDKNIAYETSSGVYLDVHQVPQYGKLSGNTLSALEAGARVSVREEKRNPTDFVLWVKADPSHIMQWDSPWGRGYPGWHIECSAMASSLLGKHVDIHTGGEDNIFPHHENEIAQSEMAHGAPFASIWMHNAHLRIKGKKMSKSEGTFYTLTDLLNRGYDPLVFRFLILQTHYRQPLNFSFESLDAAAEGLRSLNTFIERVSSYTKDTINQINIEETEFGPYHQRFTSALANDLGSPEALSIMFEVMRKWNAEVEQGTISPEVAQNIISLFTIFNTALGIISFQKTNDITPSPEVEKILKLREEARKNNDYQLADKLRQDIELHGYRIEDTPNGQRLLKHT